MKSANRCWILYNTRVILSSSRVVQRQIMDLRCAGELIILVNMLLGFSRSRSDIWFLSKSSRKKQISPISPSIVDHCSIILYLCIPFFYSAEVVQGNHRHQFYEYPTDSIHFQRRIVLPYFQKDTKTGRFSDVRNPRYCS